MVDTTEAMESQYLTAKLVQNSPTKKMVILGEGEYQEVTYNNEKTRRLTINVEIDGRQKVWRPNKDSVTNLNRVYGVDSKDWVGKQATLRIVTAKGKDMIIAEAVVNDSTK